MWLLATLFSVSFVRISIVFRLFDSGLQLMKPKKMWRHLWIHYSVRFYFMQRAKSSKRKTTIEISKQLLLVSVEIRELSSVMDDEISIEATSSRPHISAESKRKKKSQSEIELLIKKERWSSEIRRKSEAGWKIIACLEIIPHYHCERYSPRRRLMHWLWEGSPIFIDPWHQRLAKAYPELHENRQTNQWNSNNYHFTLFNSIRWTHRFIAYPEAIFCSNAQSLRWILFTRWSTLRINQLFWDQKGSSSCIWCWSCMRISKAIINQRWCYSAFCISPSSVSSTATRTNILSKGVDGKVSTITPVD